MAVLALSMLAGVAQAGERGGDFSRATVRTTVEVGGWSMTHVDTNDLSVTDTRYIIEGRMREDEGPNGRYNNITRTTLTSGGTPYGVEVVYYYGNNTRIRYVITD